MSSSTLYGEYFVIGIVGVGDKNTAGGVTPEQRRDETYAQSPPQRCPSKAEYGS